MFKSYKFVLTPSNDQLTNIKSQAGACRWVWNYMLDLNIKTYNEHKQFVFGFDQHKILRSLREEHSWLKEVNCQSLQGSCLNLDKAIKNKIQKKTLVGFPKFKQKHTNQDSFNIPQSFKLSNKAIKIPKLGWVKWKVNRKIEGKAKSITIKQELNKWYAVVLCEIPDVTKRVGFIEDEVVGLDLGIKDFVILSTGEKFSNPKYYECVQKKLKKEQRKLSKKQKQTKNYIKQRNKVAKLHRHIANQRKDFQWKLSNSIAKNYSVVCMETLDIKQMQQGYLAKNINSAGWWSFKQKMKHQLDQIGGELVNINKFFPSTKKCHICNKVNKNLTLGDRMWCCKCGQVHDRDINAALNIRNEGLLEIHRLGTSQIYACGENK